MKAKEGTAMYQALRVRDPVIRQKLVAALVSQKKGDDPRNDIHLSAMITWDQTAEGWKYWNDLHVSTIELSDTPYEEVEQVVYKVGDCVYVEESPEGYDDMVGKVVKLLQYNMKTERGDCWYTDYKIGVNSKTLGVYVALSRVRPATAEEIASVTQQREIIPGSWVVILDHQMNALGEGDKFKTVGPYEVDQVSGGCVIKMAGKVCCLGFDRFRLCTAQEIQEAGKVSEKPAIATTPEPWSAITADGVKVYISSRVWWVNPRLEAPWESTPTSLKESITAGYKLFSSKAAADKYIADKTGKSEDSWQVGDVLPEEWTRTCKAYNNAGETYWGIVDGIMQDREVEKVKNGYAYISGTLDLWLGPKSEYPTYNTEVEKKVPVVESKEEYQVGDTVTITQEADGVYHDVNPGDQGTVEIINRSNMPYYVKINGIGLWYRKEYVTKSISKQLTTNNSKPKTNQNDTSSKESSSKEDSISNSNNRCIDIPANTESIIIPKGRNSSAICDPGQPEYIV